MNDDNWRVVWAIEKSVLYAYRVLLLPAAVRHRLSNDQISYWFIESDPSIFLLFIQTTGIFLLFILTSVNIWTMIIDVLFEQSRSQFYMHTGCCCFLLLFVIVCRMTKFLTGSLNLIPVFSFSSFKRDLFLMCPLAVLRRIYGLDLLTSSVITGMRRAKAGVSPPRRSPPYSTYIYAEK